MIIVNDFPSGQTLPENFQVYVLNHHASTTPKYGSESIIIPTNNEYRHNPGCYMVCYHPGSGLYAPNNDNHFVVGQVRIAGLYNKRGMCQPLHGELFDKSLCAQFFSVCQENSCWADGNSGAWYQ